MNVNSLSFFMRFFSVTNSLALMDLVSGPSPLISLAVAGVLWAVVEVWVAVGFWGWVPWDLLSLVPQALLDRWRCVLSFFRLHRCGHVLVNTLVRIVLGL